MLENDSDNGLLYEFMRIVNQELKGDTARQDAEFYTNALEGEVGFYELYARNYPSQAVEQQTAYYDFGQLSGY